MMRELLPMLTRIAILVRESSPTAAQYLQESKTAARNLGIDLQIENERTPDDLDGIFAALKGASALVVAGDAEFTAHRVQIAELALRHQLSFVSGLREMVEAGGLMAYGASAAAEKMHRIGVLWHGANAEEEAIYLARCDRGCSIPAMWKVKTSF
jgi:putative ABC transport system substrate-binding protein